MTSDTNTSQDLNVVPSTETEQQRAQALPPSSVNPPGGINIPGVQQASGTSPRDREVRANQIKEPSEVNRDDPNINVVGVPPHGPTFREQVYGYARLIRGTVFGQSDVKKQGTQVLRGEQGIPLRRGSESSK